MIGEVLLPELMDEMGLVMHLQFYLYSYYQVCQHCVFRHNYLDIRSPNITPVR